MFEALFKRVHSDVLPLPEALFNVFLPDALDAQVLELYCHVLRADMQCTHAPLAAILANLEQRCCQPECMKSSQENEWQHKGRMWIQTSLALPRN